jgi:hypothetical protein
MYVKSDFYFDLLLGFLVVSGMFFLLNLILIFQGFDYGFDFTGIVTPPVSTDYDVTLYAKLGLYCYNFQKVTLN